MTPARFAFGPFELDTSRGVLFEHGQPVSMGARALALLQALLEARGQVVTKSALMDAAWPKTIVEESNLTVQIAALRTQLRVWSDSEEWIATFPRIGYRFAGRFTTREQETSGGFHLEVDQTLASETSKHPPKAIGNSARLSIVVLPFANLSDDPEQGYFADGVTEDITTDLSRIAGSFVIARSTAFSYKGKPIDVKAVARELGIRYVLEGSVRRLGTQVRVNAKLIDGETGTHLWTDRFDHDVQDLAAFQDEVTQRIAQALSLELIDAESRSSKRSRPNNPDAVDLAMQGWSLLNQPTNRHRCREASRIFEVSLEADNELVTALVGLATVLMMNANRGWSDDSDRDVDRAEELITKALALDPKMGSAYRVKSSILSYRFQLREAIVASETAIALNRNDSYAHRLLALYELQSEHPERSRALIEQGMRLSPRDPNHWLSLDILARAQIALGESEAALINLHKAIALNPEVDFIRLHLASAYGRLGRHKDAREAIGEFLRMNPDLTTGQPEAVKTVIRSQLELSARGYYLGIIDGRIGPFVQRALVEFQHDQDIPESGELNGATLAKLGIAPF
jgi:TolB-like protein